MTHELKTHPEFFQKIWDREKLFEARFDDRNFQVGDNVRLREYDPFSRNFSTREVYANISFKLDGGQFGVEKGYCILSLQKLKNYHVKVSGIMQNCGNFDGVVF